MNLPFDSQKLDRALGEFDVDLVLCVSKHNVQYVLGGYRYFFFAHADAIGTGRYLPIVGYFPGATDLAFYVGAGNEGWGLEVFPVWVPNTITQSWTSIDSAIRAAEFVNKSGRSCRRIAVELSFIPGDALDVLRKKLPNAEFVEALPILEELRAVKTERELEHIKMGAESIVDAMLAAFESACAGETEAELAERLRLEQTRRGLEFDYALIASGSKFGRAPSNRRWNVGESLSLDTAGYCHGYLADMARMAVIGSPDQLKRDILDEIRHVQDQVRSSIAPGRFGHEVYEAAHRVIGQCRFGKSFGFVAHGMGLISHEAPRLRFNDEIGYEGVYSNRPLRPGMVLSVETGMRHPQAGFIKLEDTLAITGQGWQAYGDRGRDWNQV